MCSVKTIGIYSGSFRPLHTQTKQSRIRVCISGTHTQKIVQRCTAIQVSGCEALSKAVCSIPYRNKGCMVDALASKSDEGRGMAAISAGEMPNNRYIPRCPNEETHELTARTRKRAYPGK